MSPVACPASGSSPGPPGGDVLLALHIYSCLLNCSKTESIYKLPHFRLLELAKKKKRKYVAREESDDCPFTYLQIRVESHPLRARP